MPASMRCWSALTNRLRMPRRSSGRPKDYGFCRMLENFRESKGWEAGVDGNVGLIKVGAGESATTAMSKEPIAAFVFDVKGLIADMSFHGAKFNKPDKGE